MLQGGTKRLEFKINVKVFEGVLDYQGHASGMWNFTRVKCFCCRAPKRVCDDDF